MRRYNRSGTVNIPLSFLGGDFIVTIGYDNFHPGYPATGPSYASGGEPAEGAEFDFEIAGLCSDNGRGKGTTTVELPGWLAFLIHDHLDGTDELFEAVEKDATDD